MIDRDMVIAAIAEQARKFQQEAEDAKARKPKKRFGRLK
jgi:hypothetical protein